MQKAIGLERNEPRPTKDQAMDGKRESFFSAGDVLDPAHRLHSSQMSGAPISSSGAVERVLSVDAVMEVARAILWPEPSNEKSLETNDGEVARAQENSPLALLLTRAPDLAMLSHIAELHGDATPSGRAHLGLAQAAEDAADEKVEREFFALFIGFGRGELPPYGSYYLTGFLDERPLARLHETLRMLRIERAESLVEGEDHAAILCEVMARLADEPFVAGAEVQQQFFEKHVTTWMGRFFVDLERAVAASFYHYAGTVGRLFLTIDAEAFALPRKRTVDNWEDAR